MKLLALSAVVAAIVVAIVGQPSDAVFLSLCAIALALLGSQMRGERGPRGLTGEAGAPGPQGPMGMSGAPCPDEGSTRESS